MHRRRTSFTLSFCLCGVLACDTAPAGASSKTEQRSGTATAEPPARVVDETRGASKDPAGLRMTNIAMVDAAAFNDAAGTALPPFDPTALSDQEVKQVHDAFAALPPFPPNAYSGCHARAHLTYQDLREPSGNKTFKVWLLSSALLTPAVSGGIRFGEADDSPRWDYHVAAAFLDSAERTWVLDSLVSATPLLLTDWIGHFQIEGFALATRMDGATYLFNKSNVVSCERGFIARDVFNGNMFGYEGQTLEKHFGAEDLAADAVIVELGSPQHTACPWRELRSSTLSLKTELNLGKEPPGCEGLVGLYDSAKSTWIERGL